jgi:hypothetical protein
MTGKHRRRRESSQTPISSKMTKEELEKKLADLQDEEDEKDFPPRQGELK